jgi:hypothetical protein
VRAKSRDMVILRTRSIETARPIPAPGQLAFVSGNIAFVRPRADDLSRSSVTGRWPLAKVQKGSRFELTSREAICPSRRSGTVRKLSQSCCGTPCGTKRDVERRPAGAGSGSRRPADSCPLTDQWCSVSASFKQALKADRMTPASLNRGCFDPSMSKTPGSEFQDRLRPNRRSYAVNSHSPEFQRGK